MNNRSVPVEHVIILPNGKRHTLPHIYFWYYSNFGLIRVSAKNPTLARVNKAYNAWPHRGGVALRFEMRKKEPIDPAGVPSNFPALLKMSQVFDANLYDEMMKLYSNLERQFESQEASDYFSRSPAQLL